MKTMRNEHGPALYLPSLVKGCLLGRFQGSVRLLSVPLVFSARGVLLCAVVGLGFNGKRKQRRLTWDHNQMGVVESKLARR